MKNSNETFNRFHRFQKLIVVILIGGLGFLGACSSDDDDTGIVDSGVSAFNFNENNTRIAAEIAAAAMEFFPAFNLISMAMLESLAGETYPPVSPFDLPLCTNAPTGSASLSWVDTDESGNLTVGDTARLTFTACDLPDDSDEIITGTVDFDAASLTEIPLSLGINVSIDLKITLDPDTTAVAGKFGFTTTTADLESFTNVYTAVDVSGQTITIAENGVTYFEVGCFTVSQTYNIADVMLGNFSLTPGGVINASNQILSLDNDPPLTFVDDAMNAGTKTLLSVARPECASIGVSGGVSNSDGTYMDMEALGGGLLILHTFREDGTEFFTEETSWTALTD